MDPAVVRMARRISPGAGPTPESVADALAVEEPLEIRLDGAPLAVTMRTPGDDVALAAGFLHAEGLLASRDDLASIRQAGENAVEVVRAAGHRQPPAPAARPFAVSSACGVCGRATLEALRLTAPTLTSRLAVAASRLQEAAAGLRAVQPGFRRTGGMHAAALWSGGGDLRAAGEDVGRHNAVDKVVGTMLLAGRLPQGDAFLIVSGRAGYEIVQKAVMAGIPIVGALSAPTSLAVETARVFGVTLAGFIRDGRLTVYTHPDRILP